MAEEINSSKDYLWYLWLYFSHPVAPRDVGVESVKGLHNLPENLVMSADE